MGSFHHDTIRKYTAALLSYFNHIEISYKLSSGNRIEKNVPLRYSSREKATILDEHTTEQLISGNYNVLPRASLSLVSMSRSEQRMLNKNTKTNRFMNNDTMEFSFNSVPYEFAFDIIIQCRGMNEATQIIEQIVPKFNPTVNIDIWDASNLSEPTRIPVNLNDVSMETDDYDEFSTNVTTITFNLALVGNLYQPIKALPRVKEFQIFLNNMKNEEEATRETMMEWDVSIDGSVMPRTLETYSMEYDKDKMCPRTTDTVDDAPVDDVTSENVTVDLGGDYTDIKLDEALRMILSRISTNEGDIQTNQDIAVENRVDVQTIDAQVTNNTAEISNNDSDIANNETSTTINSTRIDAIENQQQTTKQTIEAVDITKMSYADGSNNEFQLSSDVNRPFGKLAWVEHGSQSTDPLIALQYRADGKLIRVDYYLDRSTFIADGSGRNAMESMVYSATNKLESVDYEEL